ncbi:unnamed protein product [Heterobilharzia americana]|nr:unnamed protein product [Heterobilharzia americana]CAH8535196.1 unnamed protein product [Heterobilharzia americana]
MENQIQRKREFNKNRPNHKRRTIADEAKRTNPIKVLRLTQDPLRPIVLLPGTPYFNSSKELYRKLKHLINGSQHSVSSATGFLDKIKDLRIDSDEKMISFDVTLLLFNLLICSLGDDSHSSEERPNPFWLHEDRGSELNGFFRPMSHDLFAIQLENLQTNKRDTYEITSIRTD